MQVTVVTVITLALLSAWTPARASADGDPPSDVLVSQPLFLPTDGGIPPSQHAELSRLVKTANQSGYQLRVAMIATPVDLGSVGELWRQPSSYAHFLGLELSLVYRGTLLVGAHNRTATPAGGSNLEQCRAPRPAELKRLSQSQSQSREGVSR